MTDLRAILPDTEPFLAVARHRNYRRAAEELRLTPAALSKAISRLEAALQTRLLVRTTRRVDLTPEGATFLARCQEAHEALTHGIRALELGRDSTTGTVRISASPVLGRYLAAQLPGLLSRYPGLEADLSLRDNLADLAAESIDIAIRIGASAAPHLVTRRLARLNWITLAAPDYLTRHGTPQSPGDLATHACLSYTGPSDPVPWTFRSGEATTQTAVTGPLRLDQGALLLDAAASGLGIVQVFSFMARDALHSGRLIPILRTFDAPGPQVHALTLPGRQDRPRIRATLDYLYACFRQIG